MISVIGQALISHGSDCEMLVCLVVRMLSLDSRFSYQASAHLQ